MSEVELAYRLAEAPIYAITGTNGKTTTTTLLGLLLQTSFGNVALAEILARRCVKKLCGLARRAVPLQKFPAISLKA